MSGDIGFTAVTPASGCLNFDVVASTDGADEIVIRIPRGPLFTVLKTPTTVAWTTYLKRYETVNK